MERFYEMKRVFGIQLGIAEQVVSFVDTVVICTYLVNLILRKKFVFTVRISPWHETGSRFAKFMRKIIGKTTDAIMLQNREQEE